VAPKFLRKYQPAFDAIRDHPLCVRYASWLRHPRLWHLNRRSAPGAVAIGLFAGLVPGPLQMLAALLLAVPLRQNLPLALLTTLYTNPLTIVPLYVLAYTYGHFLMGSSAPDVHIDPMRMEWSELIALGEPLALGLFALALTLAAICYVAVGIAWRIHVVRAWRRRQHR
jgi:uncharacterized protein (DUF2062 family)